MPELSTDLLKLWKDIDSAVSRREVHNYFVASINLWNWLRGRSKTVENRSELHAYKPSYEHDCDITGLPSDMCCFSDSEFRQEKLPTIT